MRRHQTIQHHSAAMTTSRTLHLSLVLIFIVLVSISQAFGMFSCCRKYTKQKLRLKNTESFYIQDSSGVCNMDAVIFNVRSPCNLKATPEGYCADPKQKWVQRLTRALENLAKQGKPRRIKKQQKKCKRQRKSYG